MAQQRRTIKKSNSAPSHPVEEEKKGKRPSHPVQEEEHKVRPKMPISTKREIIFILLLFASFLLILGIYGTNLLVDDPESSVGSITGSSIIGHLGVITKWLVTGLFGVIAYIIPILCFAAGIYIIRNKDSEKSKSSIYISGFIFTVCLSALFYIFQYSVNDAEFDFMKIWKFGTLNFGGGIIGSFMGFPLVFLAKQVGASIITIAVMLMSFIAMTDFIITKRIAALVRKAKLSGANKAKAEEDGENIPVVTSGENPALAEKKRKSRSFDVADDIVPKDEPDYTSLIDEVEKLPKTGEKPASDVTQVADIFKFTPKEKEIPAFVPPAEKVQPSEDVYPAPEGEGEELPEGVTIVKPKRLEGEIPVEISRENESIPYTFPDTSLLNRLSPSDSSTNPQKIQELAAKLVETLKSFNIEVKVREISIGPAITRFELQPTAGVRVNKITSLADDIALSLAATTVRIEAPIPGKAAIGIEIPNESVATVSAREVLESTEFTESKSKLSIALGRDIAGKCIVGDIAKMPHVLIAGATGSGKSVCINSLIASILYKASPNEVKLIMIDPKVVELSVYNGIPHLLIPVVTDPRKAAGSLNWAVQEMTTRYKFFADEGVRDLKGYNALMEKEGRPRLPQIVIIIDELADLMMVAPKDVETYICRLAQLARAAGMHLVIATQRPSVNVITGVIKANIPSRIAFAVSSYIDSRTILDTIGAEKLLGRGDMLYYPMGATKPTRVQGAFISDEEVEKLVEFVKKDSEVHYDEDVLEQLERAGEDQSDGADDEDAKEADALLPQAIEIVIDSGQASVSLVQRKLSVGYARAGRLVDQMEARGIVGPSEGSKPRRVLVTKAEYLAMMEGAGIGNASSESSVIPEADENAAFANTIPAPFGDDTIPYDDNDDEDDGDIIMPPSDN